MSSCISPLPFLPKACAQPPASSVKALRFAPMNVHTTALTARAAGRGEPRRKGICFLCTAPAVRRKQKSKPFKGVLNAANQTPTAVFARTDCGHTRRTGRTPKSRTTTAGVSLSPCFWRVGRALGRRPSGKPNQPGAWLSAPQQLPNKRRRKALADYGVGPLGHHDSFARRVLRLDCAKRTRRSVGRIRVNPSGESPVDSE